MQERRVRLGDVLDDYCPRERRITNHVAVAIVDDDVKQTRCATCDAEHVYKHARVPAARRKKDPDVAGQPAPLSQPPEAPPDEQPLVEDPIPETLETVVAAAEVDVEALFARVEAEGDDEAAAPTDRDEDWPVHRRLIRATLPRPEGQAPERKAPDFFHHTAGRPDRQQRGGNRHPDHHRGQHAQGQGFRHGGGQHSGNARRQGGQVDGNRAAGQPGNRSGHGRRSRRGGR